MEIDVDDVLQYPEDDLFPQDFDNGHEDGERATRPRGASSPQAKRRSLPTNEFVNKLVHLDEAVLDPSLDWYLRIDLNNAKPDLENREQERKIDEAIRRIQLARAAAAHLGGSCVNIDSESGSETAAKIHNYPPRCSSHWMPVTTPVDKTRYYITLKSDQMIGKLSLEMRNKDQLLGEDFEQLLAKANELNDAKLTRGVQEPAAAALPDTCTVYFSEPMDSDRVGNVEVNSERPSESALWVDKYKPRAYIDLLSDDGVNRTLLTWLKLWDECVFRRKVNTRTNIKRFTGPGVFKERMFNKGGFRNGKGGGNQAIDADSLPTTLDNYKRPVHKVALLSGPPGVGKTTLAHIVARHAGYHVQEMNASDDRSLEAFRKQLEGATQMQATLDGDRRPHCLVIDEIDGAPAASINFLVSLIITIDETGNADQSANKMVSSKKRSGSFILRRPIICICNDLFVPALRELRKIALVLQVPPIELSRLTDRLCQISSRETVKAEPGCFEIMCTKSGYDVRSCINSLQLLTFCDDAGKEKKSEKKLTLKQIAAADIGGKDMQRSLFSAWQEVFQLPRIQKRTIHNETPMCSTSSRVKNVLLACEQCGEEDRLQAGLFENYLLVDFRDPRLESVLHGLEWLAFVDQLDRMVGETQQFTLKRYSFYLAAVFHLLFASRQFTKLVYPQMAQDGYFKTTRALATLQSLMSDIKCNIRAFLNCNILITDVLPLVLEITQPQFRPVNVQLYSEQEKVLLQRVVNAMRDYNLTYRQQRSVHGQYEFVLEPPIEEIVNVSASTPQAAAGKLDRPPIALPQKVRLPHTVKQAIAHEIELAKVRTKEPKANVGEARKGTNQASMEPLSGHDRLKRKQNSLKARLFGINQEDDRVGHPEPANDQATATGERRVWFRYHEGCNDAIRRFLRVSDLL